jgi:hypothetical protein
MKGQVHASIGEWKSEQQITNAQRGLQSLHSLCGDRTISLDGI